MSRLSDWRAIAAAVTIIGTLGAPALAQQAEAPATPNPHPFGAVGRPHVLPVRPPEYFGVPRAPAVGAHLSYYGGRVVSNMQVVQVLWGTGAFLPQLQPGAAAPNMQTFYQQALNSPYVDWLSEYNTIGLASPTSNQAIGRGSFGGVNVITPSTSAKTVDDTTIQAELLNQIAAGHLPAPTTDAAGNNNTYYAIFFPQGVTITQGGTSSCVSGGFCAYHGTIAATGGVAETFYGVHPDMQSGSGCYTGCGGSASVFANQTSVASHEMVETATDAEVGLATTYAPPLAWYDSRNGEIGDICNGQQGTFVGSDGVTYTVQKEWSNSQSACIVTKSGTGGGSDFSMALSPTTVTVKAGAAATTTVSLADLGSSAVTVSLTISGLPSTVKGTFNPASVSVTSSAASTLTISTTRRARKSTYTATVTATSGSFTHTVTLPVTVQ